MPVLRDEGLGPLAGWCDAVWPDLKRLELSACGDAVQNRRRVSGTGERAPNCRREVVEADVGQAEGFPHAQRSANGCCGVVRPPMGRLRCAPARCDPTIAKPHKENAPTDLR